MIQVDTAGLAAGFLACDGLLKLNTVMVPICSVNACAIDMMAARSEGTLYMSCRDNKIVMATTDAITVTMHSPGPCAVIEHRIRATRGQG